MEQLIAGCGKKTATFLQTMKETGARCGEVWRLRWIDVDFENCILTIPPEKRSNPPQLKVSRKLNARLNALPREDEKDMEGKDENDTQNLRVFTYKECRDNEESTVEKDYLPYIQTLEDHDEYQ